MNLAFRNFVSTYWVLFLLLAIKFILQFVLVNPVYELHRDEFLHLNQAFHPAAGYISVPPLTSWIASIIYLLGGDLFWIRFFPALFGALTIIFVWFIVEEAGGKLAAKILASVFLIFSVFTRLNVLFQPNAFDIMAWTAIFYFSIKYINSQQVKWLLLLSVAIALGLYNKYNVVFLIVGLFIGMFATSHRIIFANRSFYMAVVFCLFLIIPNLIWQVTHHFPVFQHMKALSQGQLVNVNRMDFLVDQLKYGAFGILAVSALLAFIFYKPFKNYRFIGITFLTVLFLYTISRAKNYYILGVYPVLYALGSVYLEASFKSWRVFWTSLIVFLQIALFFVVAKFIMPVQSPSQITADKSSYEKLGLLHWEDGKNHPLPQDFADMVGWREMADKAFQAYQMIPLNEREYTLIFCDNYGQTGALNYYNRNKMPEATSYNADYIYWLPRFKKIQNIVFVGELPDPMIVDMFKQYKLVGVVENKYAREKGKRIFLLLGADPGITELFYKTAEVRRKKFDIF